MDAVFQSIKLLVVRGVSKAANIKLIPYNSDVETYSRQSPQKTKDERETKSGKR